MADLPQLLLASLNPQTRKQAEASLTNLSVQPGFLPHLLALVLNANTDRSVRLAGSVYLKNVVKGRWDDEAGASLSSADKETLRNQLVPATIALSAPSDKALRAQIAESVSMIATLDFPERWPNLLYELTSALTPTDYAVNSGVLETAHSIFRPWRSAVRSDELFTTINLVLGSFMKPFLDLFRHTASLLLESSPSANTPAAAQMLTQATDVFYDLTCQDLPPDVEDNFDELFGSSGLFLRFLAWDCPPLQGAPDDTSPSIPSLIKTGILEIAEMYTKLYPEMMQKAGAVPAIVRAVWALVGAGTLISVGDDGLVSQCLRFVSTTIRSGHYTELFSARDTISGLVQGVVVPNLVLREHDLEQFEDDPLEFIRQDLALPAGGAAGAGVGEVSTRRQAAADVVRALVASGFEQDTTQIVGGWIGPWLQQYAADPASKWKEKDCAVYLFTALATKGSTTQHGVTSTNALVNVVDFFTQNVFQDLQGGAHPMLQVDAIRFLYTFRNQLSKAQLLSVFPLLHQHLGSDNYVCYTYAAITIDRILFIKEGQRLMFAQADVRDVAPAILESLLAKVEAAGTPQKIAENDHLMKSAMRVIMTARQALTPGFERTLQRLVGILGVISTNPSNPNFDQYIFESISALMRFVVGGTPTTLPTFEQTLFPAFTIILQQDIDQYVPYTFQIIAQMLELHSGAVPAEYRALLPFLLTPAVWQQKGSVPGLVKLLRAFLARDAAEMIRAGQYQSVLGVIQGRLIPSKINDIWGFELLQAVVQNVPPTVLKEHFKVILVNLLSRLQTSKTDRFVYSFSYFMLFTMAIPVEGMTPDFLIGTMEEVQPGLWSQILINFVIPQAPKLPVKDRKVAVIGLTRMLTQSQNMLQGPSLQAWPQAFSALGALFRDPQHLERRNGVDGEDADAALTAIDFEEQTAGYQAAYSRLAASETTPIDPVANVTDPKAFLGKELGRLVGQNANVRSMLGTINEGPAAALKAELNAAGYAT